MLGCSFLYNIDIQNVQVYNSHLKTLCSSKDSLFLNSFNQYFLCLSILIFYEIEPFL